MSSESISIQIKILENWIRKNSEALAPLNGGLIKMIKEEFESHPELTELYFVLDGTNFVAKRDNFIKD